MNNKSKLIFAFATGALVGAGIAALLSSDKGKDTLAKAKDKMNEFGEEAEDSLSKFEREIVDVLKNMRKKENPSV